MKPHLEYILLYGMDSEGEFRRLQLRGKTALRRARLYAAEFAKGEDAWRHISAAAWDDSGTEHNITAMLTGSKPK